MLTSPRRPECAASAEAARPPSAASRARISSASGHKRIGRLRAWGGGQEGLRTDIFVRNSPRELIDVVLRRPERGHLPRGAARGARRVSSARAARAPGPSDLAPPTPSLSPARFYIGHGGILELAALAVGGQGGQGGHTCTCTCTCTHGLAQGEQGGEGARQDAPRAEEEEDAREEQEERVGVAVEQDPLLRTAAVTEPRIRAQWRSCTRAPASPRWTARPSRGVQQRWRPRRRGARAHLARRVPALVVGSREAVQPDELRLLPGRVRLLRHACAVSCPVLCTLG